MNWPQWVREAARAAKQRSKKPRSSWAQLVHILDFYDVAEVFDVGANAGQYAQGLRRHGYAGRIRSFEPLIEFQEPLKALASNDPQWTIEAPVALGAETRMIELLRSPETDMSSVRAPNALHKAVSPSSSGVEAVRVQQVRFCDVAGELRQPAHLKLDVQGYEDAVLDGAGPMLERLTSIQLEMALRPLYEQEPGWQDMVKRLEDRGFELALIIPGYFERKIPAMLQFDGVFVNRRASALHLDRLTVEQS